ncbi:MAG: 3-deoxy-7-phosphoheptulonate synthase [Bacteroidota bacterium]|nr:3-deoxy-7-phosphoheptulonate synthase [Bacteroidota bacterium]
MIVFFTHTATHAQIAEMQLHLKQLGFDSQLVPGQNICLVHKLKDEQLLANFPFVSHTQIISSSYQLASNAYKTETNFQVNGIQIGTHFANIIAGPCSVENEKQIFETAAFLAKNNIKFIRGGAYKPRTSPYSFRGLGKDGLKLLHEAAKTYQLNVVTELMDLSLLDEVAQYTDIIQIGSRNMANFYLLGELGKINLPILLKRGMQANVNEFLLAADYILSGGNEKVILCERGIRSFDPMSRNVMDVGVIPLIQSLSHLPIMADPSHGTGDAKFVNALAKASLVAGANGLMVEIHPNPKLALSDANQALTFEAFEQLLSDIELLKPTIQKPIDATYSILV